MYEDSKLKLSLNCQKNHIGSSYKIKINSTIKILHRSQSERGMKYINYVGEDDSKIYTFIVYSKPYSNAQKPKLQYVKNIQKPMGARLQKQKFDYKYQKPEDSNKFCGKGGLMNVSNITAYYDNVINFLYF